MAKSNSSGSFSVIGADIVITGDISASTELHVDGTVNGDLTCASLVQGEGSSVKGAIKAESARLAGTVDGSIDARELVILRSATITGDVHYDALTIEQGAQVDGRFAPRGSGKAQPQSPLAAKPGSAGDEPQLSIAT
ncbi:polymer-forming cytoskeletal protein [Altererythrobacter sp. MTPC7]|uniref:bactofilin family protein n=1 Tax=Altererythrobacter sp. MTPC7 TaxID=3056567 RepID=UPI0036F2B896